MGRICFDLELKTTPSGVPVLSTRLAVDRNYRAQGEDRKTDFINIVAWRSNAEFIAKYFAKGRLILVDGELQTRQYVDKNNMTRDVVEVVVNSAHFTGERATGAGGGYNQLPPPPDQEPAGRRYGGGASPYGGGASPYGGGSLGGDSYGAPPMSGPPASSSAPDSFASSGPPLNGPPMSGSSPASAPDFGGPLSGGVSAGGPLGGSGGDDDDYPF